MADQPHTAHAARAASARVRAAFRDQEGCLHPDAPEGCNRIVDAHSIQKKGPLFHLKDKTNHVYAFDPYAEGDDPIPVGWNRASTFRGLCHAHDQIFRPIENVPFSGSLEQLFLVSYRATYLEIHQKRAAIATCNKVGYADMAKMRSVGVNEAEVRQMLREQQAGRQKGLAEITALKRTYDRAWRTNDFSGLDACVVRYDGTPAIASAGMVSPDFLVGGERLQELHRPGMESLAYGTFLTGEAGAFAFTWPAPMTKMGRFVESLVSLPQRDLAGALILFMFSYVSNTFFQPEWWLGLRLSKRLRLAEAGRRIQQYYTPVNYRIGTVVDWTKVRIEFHRAVR